MSTKHIHITLLLITVPSVFGKDSISSGSFEYFCNCVIKFVTLNDTFEYSDLTEHLIHVNNPNTLIFTVSGRLNFSNLSIEDEKVARDFKFYETCTIAVFVNFGIEDNQFRFDYLVFTRDVHRSLVHSTMILIFRRPTHHLMMHAHRYDYVVPYRVFAVDLEQEVLDRTSILIHLEFKWFFYCTYCKTMFIPVRYTSQIKTLTVMSLHAHEWMNDVSIGAVYIDRFKPGGICGKGQYHIAPTREQCSVWETQYLVMSNILNVTFHQFIFGKEQPWRWIFKSVMRPWYQFYYMNTLFSLHYHGRDLIYCNFNVWSDNSDFDVWVSPHRFGLVGLHSW